MTRKPPGHWDNGTNELLAPLTLVLWVKLVQQIMIFQDHSWLITTHI